MSISSASTMSTSDNIKDNAEKAKKFLVEVKAALDSKQNLADDITMSAINQGTDVVTMFTVLKGFRGNALFYASLGTLGFNVAARAILAGRRIFFPPPGVVLDSGLGAFAGALLMLIEPIAGSEVIAASMGAVRTDRNAWLVVTATVLFII